MLRNTHAPLLDALGIEREGKEGSQGKKEGGRKREGGEKERVYKID